MSQNVYPLPTAQGHNTTELCCSTVLGHAGTRYLLSDTTTSQAAQALSCLVEPYIGDVVLVSRETAQHPAYILAVLNRQGALEGSVVLPGGSRLHDKQGQLQLNAASIAINGKTSVGISTPRLDVNAVDAAVRVRRWTSWFDSVESYAVNVALTAKTVSSRVGRLWQRSVESLRQTEKLDETQAGRVKVSSQGHHRIQAQHISHKAEGFVKIDGRKIDLG